MTELEIKIIYNRLHRGISNLSHSTFNFDKQACKEDALKVLSDSKDQLRIWLTELEQNNISIPQFEQLVYEKRKNIRMGALINQGFPVNEIDIYKYCVLRLMVNTVVDFIWEQRFRNLD